MKWIKKGFIFKPNGEYKWMKEYAQVPRALILEDRVRIFYVQDLSWDMLEICKLKLADTEAPVEIHQGNACKLPHANRTFDAVYSFGGIGMNTYADNKMAIAELVRGYQVGR